MGSIDDIGAVERAYRLDASDAAWLEGVRDALAPLADCGLGVSMGCWALEDGALRDVAEASGGVDGAIFDALKALVHQLPPEFVASRYGPDAREFVGPASEFSPGQAAQLVLRPRGRGAVYMFGALCFGNPGRNGLVLNSFSEEPPRVTAGRVRRLKRLLTHVSAAYRLRLALQRQLTPADAVLTPGGKVVHAEASVREGSLREVLGRAVRDIERARGKLRKTSPSEALSLWKGLVAGRWSIVDWVDADGRRYLVARSNPVSARDPRALSARELDVAEYVVQGRSIGEIAYALGLAEGTVSQVVAAVLRKLGAARRSDLAGLFGAVAPFRASLPGAKGATVLAAGSDAALWRRLSRAEVAVVSRVLAGQPAARVAAARKVSVKTVNNQLGAVYALFGVRGKTELAALLGRPPPEVTG